MPTACADSLPGSRLLSSYLTVYQLDLRGPQNTGMGCHFWLSCRIGTTILLTGSLQGFRTLSGSCLFPHSSCHDMLSHISWCPPTLSEPGDLSFPPKFFPCESTNPWAQTRSLLPGQNSAGCPIPHMHIAILKLYTRISLSKKKAAAVILFFFLKK